MAYVISEPCIGTKDTSCVEVCPVDCIHPTPDEPGFAEAEQLYIDPEECIDCDACVEACPVDAITAEDQVPTEWRHYIGLNAAYYKSGRERRASAGRRALFPLLRPRVAVRPARPNVPRGARSSPRWAGKVSPGETMPAHPARANVRCAAPARSIRTFGPARRRAHVEAV